ncbi:multidrug efflux pump subunit AcrB [Bosea sp. BE271]|uniref:efflux RND transporter permease subunit n=1 Tax=Bosea TaxID=85413 RepID=UPI0028570E05|nr:MULTISPECIES: efflux RND transporter permease subunit [Bosea]MDR6831048.1 multidrug efflux pump subunit AcrB [Bosea robiniae]MDR6897760.1 multidrug efflux pump subunit AcrB [Bosea sp. BE109]MDR7141157.1 multidrug efflux pump subunit AcrB [Bosea sp. BE168]MDR7177705.1 multidrug efflux pump subunit AcrB [Bosea sp. BE271]
MSFNLSEWALKSRSVVIYLMVVAVVAGVFAFIRLGRNEDPAFVIKTMVVSAVWPGASMEETLSQVTERLERQIEETPGLDSVRSFTRPGVTTIFVNLKGDVPGRQVQDTWYRVRNLIADMRHTLPAGTLGPFFNDRFGDTFGIIYGFTSDGFTSRELRDHVEAIRSRLLLVPDVSKIEIVGAQDERIFIEFSVRELANLGLDRGGLLAALQAQNVVRPAGEIQTQDEKFSVRVSGAFQSEADLLNINFPVGDRMVRLADIATVRRGQADPPTPMFRVNGRESIGLGIAMREGGDILALGRNIKKAMAEVTAGLPLGIEPNLVADQAVTVSHAIDDFMMSLWQAVGIIMVVSFISLGVRPGLVVALAIPLTLAIVFACMLVAGIDMQRISLGALIIALALLVDDAMTTTDAMVTRLAAGEEKLKAATFAFEKYATAMLAGTLVTIAGFVPIGFAASSAGEYTFSLFAVVTIALVVSWFVAVLFAPVLGVAMLKAPDASKQTKEPGRVERGFRSLLSRAIKLRWITIAVTLGLFAASILALPLVPRQFFPASDRPELLVDFTLPQNASIYASEDLVNRFEATLKGDPDIERWSTYIGRGAIRFYLPLDARLPNDFFSQSVIVAKDVAARERLQKKLEALLAKEFPNVVGRVSPLELGPPVGWPVQYRVSGPDTAEVRSIALRLGQVMAANPNARQINFDWIEPSRELRLRVDQDEARRLGLSSAAVAAIVNTVVSGTVVTQVRDSIYLVDVVVRAQDSERVSLDTLRSMQVALPSGRSVPVSQFVSFSYGLDAPLVWRRDRVPNLTVAADVAPGVLPDAVVNALQPSIDGLRKSLPAGYDIAVGGSVEESAKSQASVIAVIPVMLLIMFTVLMAQLRSFRLFAIVLSIAPLGLIGVVGALLLSGKPLGFVALLGILALIGIITKNAVILIGQIEDERAAGKGVVEAAIDAAGTRFRPIMLTAVSTVLGMIPIAPTVFWGPMAFAIMGGLLVATVLTLVLLPVLYVAVFGAATGRSGAKRPANAGGALS